jgi:hypothetical protein
MSTAVRATSTAGTLATDGTQVTPRAAITTFYGRVDSNSRDNCNITTDASNRMDLSSSSVANTVADEKALNCL